MQQNQETAVQALSLAGRHDEAIALAREAVGMWPSDAISHFTLSRALLEADHLEEAFRHAEKSIKLDTRNAQYAYFAGSVASELNWIEVAIPYFEVSASLDKTDPRPHSALARCYRTIFQPHRASQHYGVALKLARSKAEKDEVLILNAHNLATANNRNEAKAIYNQVFDQKGPMAIDALIALAELSKEGVGTSIGRLLAKSVSDPKLKVKTKASALLALGKLHETDEHYDRAFGCWQSSRTLSKTLPYKLHDHQSSLEQANHTYPVRAFQQLSSSGCGSKIPVFISGMPRSGTTLLEQVISSHSQAAGAGEVARWELLNQEFTARLDGVDLMEFLSADQNKNEMQRRGEDIVRILKFMSGSEASRIVEKTPRAQASLGYIKLCCPNAKFIHILRHPLDAFISTYQSSFREGHSYAYDQLEYAKEYVWHLLMMKLWRLRFPESIFSVKYEDLVREPETHARKIIEFIGLEWEDACLEFYKSSKPVLTLSTIQVRQPIHDKSIGRWKNYARHLGPLMNHLVKGGVNWEQEW